MFSVGDASGEGGREETDFGSVGVVEEDEEEDGDEVDKASGEGTAGGGVGEDTVDTECCCGEARGVMTELEDWSREELTGDAKELPLGLFSCRSSLPRASSRSVLLSW